MPRDKEAQDGKLLDEIKRRERDSAVASKKEDYAKRPASYKSALSLALPVGTLRKKDNPRENSPDRQHILVNNPAAYKEKEKKDDGKQMNRED